MADGVANMRKRSRQQIVSVTMASSKRLSSSANSRSCAGRGKACPEPQDDSHRAYCRQPPLNAPCADLDMEKMWLAAAEALENPYIHTVTAETSRHN